MSFYRKYGLIGFLVLVLALCWFFNLSAYLNLETIRAHHHALEKIVAEHYFLALFLYFILYVMIAFCSIPMTAFTAMIGGFLFDQWIGTCVTVIAATFGATILFLSVKSTTAHALMSRNLHWVEKMRRGFEKNAFYYLLVMRLVPIFPFFAVNLAAALLYVPLRTFFWATLTGTAPLVFIYTSIGSGLQNMLS